MPFYLRISAPRLLSSYKISIGICILCVSPSPFSFAIYNSLHIVLSVQDLEAKKYSVFKVYIQTYLCRNQCFRFSMTCILFYWSILITIFLIIFYKLDLEMYVKLMILPTINNAISILLYSYMHSLNCLSIPICILHLLTVLFSFLSTF